MFTHDTPKYNAFVCIKVLIYGNIYIFNYVTKPTKISEFT